MLTKKLALDKDDKNVITHIAIAFFVKGISLFVSLFSTPLYIKYFDNNVVLGLWYTVLSLLSWIQLCDLGLGNGLRNSLTEALAFGEKDKSRRLISSTYAALSAVIAPIMVIGCITISLFDFNLFLNVSESLVSPKTMRIAITILFVGVCLNFVLKTINVVFYAIQKSSVNNVIALVSSIVPLVYILIFNGKSLESNLISLTVVHVVATNLPLLFAGIIIFKKDGFKDLTPNIRSCDFKTAKGMLGVGAQFFLAQIFFMFLISSNEIIITKMFSSEVVVEYSIYFKLFTVVGSLFMLALTPLWSKVTKDLAQKKYLKIQKVNRLLYALSALAIVAEFIMVLVLQFVVDIWLGDERIIVSNSIGLIFAFYGGMYILNVVLTTVANGMGNLKTQIVFYGVGSALKIPVIYALSKTFDHWSIVVFYNALILMMFCAFQLIWIEKIIQKNIKENELELKAEEN